MMKKITPLAAVAAITFLLPLVGHAQAQDNASNYSGANPFIDGANQGTGFRPFTLTSGSNAGFFLSTSTNNGTSGSGGIDTGGQSFGLFANSGDIATAVRPFDFNNSGTATPLATNQAFNISFDNGNIQNGGVDSVVLGNAGNSLYTFSFTGGQSNYFFNGADTGLGFTADGLNLSYTLNSSTSYTFTATRLSNNQTYSVTGTSGSAISIDRVSVINNNAGNNNPNNLYFNSLAITPTPEPGGMMTLLLGAVLLGCVLVARRRRGITA